MPGMPYSLEVGMILSAFAEHTEDEKKLVSVLNSLNAGTSVGDILNTATFKVPDPKNPTGLKM
ncbi:MAG: hypothetical protein QOJ58_5937, partial [Alphaproteobacteria bacterium]|nr:hypothetical protein [Alphaproteobacteria bacterium]